MWIWWESGKLNTRNYFHRNSSWQLANSFKKCSMTRKSESYSGIFQQATNNSIPFKFLYNILKEFVFHIFLQNWKIFNRTRNIRRTFWGPGFEDKPEKQDPKIISKNIFCWKIIFTIGNEFSRRRSHSTQFLYRIKMFWLKFDLWNEYLWKKKKFYAKNPQVTYDFFPELPIDI